MEKEGRNAIRNDCKRQTIKSLCTNILPTLLERFIAIIAIRKTPFLILYWQITDAVKRNNA